MKQSMTSRKTTTPRFLVERHGYGEDIQHIIDEIESQGFTYRCPKYVPFEGGEYNQFKDDECVVFFGSLNLARTLVRSKPWVPGPFCDLKNLKCSIYYAYFGKYLFNDTYYMMPYADMKRQLASILIDWDIDCCFVRPDDGFKTFTGQLVSDEYGPLYEEFGYIDTRTSPETLCIVAPPQKIKAEWRFFIADKEPVSASQYRIDGVHKEEYGAPTEIWDYVRKVLSEVDWVPQRAFVMDIAQSVTGNVGVLELNSYSCSGFYKCNPAPIIQAAARIALEDWEDINNI